MLCALACVREASAPDVDLVILASRDTDLVPVLDEVYDMHGKDPRRNAKIETVAWHDRNGRRFGHLRATNGRRIWNTDLDRASFEASIDRNDDR